MATLWVPAAQAVTVASHGPRKPYRMDTSAAARLPIIIGTRNGLTRRAPLLAEHADLRFQGFQATHARSDDDTRPVGIEGEAAAVQTAGVGQGLGCRYRRELGEAVNPPEILGPVEISGIEVRADPAGARRLGAEQAIPKRVPADAAGRHHADTRDGDPATLNALTAVGRGVNRQHQSFEDTSSKA